MSTSNISSDSPENWKKTNSENGNKRLTTNLQIALKYNQLEFPVIPVHHGTKVAAVKWEPYQSKISTRDEIQEWFSNTNYNIAIVLGRISSSFEIDIDGELGKKYFEEKLLEFNLNLQSSIRNTMRVVTSKGLKMIFRFRPEEWPEGIKSCNSLWVGGKKHNRIELRANGSYSLGIGSVHPDGTPYVLAAGSEFNPVTLPKLEIEEIVRRISGEDLDNDEKMVYETASGEDLPGKIVPLETLGENTITVMAPKARKYYSEGTKNYFTLAYCGNLRRLGVSYEDAYKLACIIDPADTKNLKRIKYIYNYTGKLPGKGFLIKILREQFGLDSLEIVNALQELLSPIERIRKKQQQKEHSQEEERRKGKYNDEKIQNSFNYIETKKPPADILYDLATDTVLERFEDENTCELYAVYEVNGHKEVHSLESIEFQYFLRQLFEKDHQKQQEYFQSKDEASKRGTLFDFLRDCEKVQLKIFPHEKIIGKEHLNNSIQQLKLPLLSEAHSILGLFMRMESCDTTSWMMNGNM